MTLTARQRLRLALLRAVVHFERPPGPIHASSNGIKVQSVAEGKADTWHAPRILVVRPDHLGDLLFTTPALQALRQRYSDAHITALVGPWSGPILTNNPHVDEILCLPFPGFTRESKPSLWQPYGLVRQWAQQLHARYDVAFILRCDHWWGALLAYLAGVPERVGYGVLEVAPFLSHAVRYTRGQHEVVQNLRLVARDALDGGQAGSSVSTYPPTHYPLEFHVPEGATFWARNAVQSPERSGGQGARPIAIHPGAGAAIKLWRTGRWAAVADGLADETGAQIILTGSEAERALCLEIATQMKNGARVMAGETSLDQLAAVFAACRLVVGLDSGPLHLAVTTGAPTVHLYGPVDPTTFGPWGAPERHRVVRSAWPCIPCNRLDYAPEEIAHHPCIREISVEAVMEAARQALSS